MINRLCLGFLLVIVMGGLIGCAVPRSYVDQRFPSVRYGDLQPQTSTYHWRLNAEFQRNGQRAGRGEPELWSTTAFTRRSGVIKTVPEALDTTATGDINIVLNNTSKGTALAGLKGLCTG